MDILIESYDEFKNNEELNEKVYRAPKAGFTKADIEKILKDKGDLSLYVELDKATYYVAPYMHVKGKLEKGDNDIFFPVNNAGKTVQVNFSDISFITA